MDSAVNEGIKPPPSAEIMLKGEYSRYKAFMGMAQEAENQRDVPSQDQHVLEAGEIIAGLSDMIMQDGVNRAGLTQAHLDLIKVFSEKARFYLDHNQNRAGILGISLLFNPLGSRLSGKTEMEKLLEEAYPIEPANKTNPSEPQGS